MLIAFNQDPVASWVTLSFMGVWRVPSLEINNSPHEIYRSTAALPQSIKRTIGVSMRARLMRCTNWTQAGRTSLSISKIAAPG
jgi:hypothetical protein